MNGSFTFLVIATAMLIVTVVLLKIGKVRYVYIVPEGCAGLLYHKGKFVGTLGAGRHVRWGRFFSTRLQDVRKASLVVAGQEVLTADNVGLKISLLVTYQVSDAAPSTRSSQSGRSAARSERRFFPTCPAKRRRCSARPTGQHR